MTSSTFVTSTVALSNGLLGVLAARQHLRRLSPSLAKMIIKLDETERPGRTGRDAGRQLTGLGPLDAHVALDYHFAVARKIDYSERAGEHAEPAANATIRIEQHRAVRRRALDGFGGADRHAGGIFAMAALERHAKFSDGFDVNPRLWWGVTADRLNKGLGLRMRHRALKHA